MTDAESASWARRFHELYERLAPQYGYETRPETQTLDLTSPNGRLMVAVCRELMGPVLQAHAEAMLVVETVETQLGRARAERDELCEMLVDVLLQTNRGVEAPHTIDSFASSTIAAAIQLLVRHGFLALTRSASPRWIQARLTMRKEPA
jgi:hypothetical protein